MKLPDRKRQHGPDRRARVNLPAPLRDYVAQRMADTGISLDEALRDCVKESRQAARSRKHADVCHAIRGHLNAIRLAAGNLRLGVARDSPHAAELKLIDHAAHEAAALLGVLTAGE